jgi:hypothetical protein
VKSIIAVPTRGDDFAITECERLATFASDLCLMESNGTMIKGQL